MPSASQNLLCQPRSTASQDTFYQSPQTILPACAPGMAAFNPHYPRRYSTPEFAFIPLSLRDKNTMFGGGFMAQYGGYQSALFQAPTEEEKPNQSYIGLIGKAILSSPQQKMVLSDIYNFVLTHYPYFRNKGPGWRNSIRHNLSLNECFLKVGRSPNGKGHFWAINPANLDDFSKGEYRRKRAQKRKRNSVQSQNGEEEAKFKNVNRDNGENSTFSAHECRSEDSSSERDERKPQAIKIRPRQQQDVENRGFHIETLLGDLKSNREIPLKAANPIGYSKENSAFSVVSKAMYPTYGSPAMSGPGLWSDGQSVRTAGYPHQLLVLANCSSQQLLKPATL